MPTRVYHQVGHFSNWNLNAYQDKACGDGLILSPVHQTAQQIAAIKQQTRAKSVFDPQFYLPNSPKRKLVSYDFFPERISSGFTTVDFDLVALESARRCIAFQMENDFEAIIIPARFVDQMVSDFFERQEAFSVLPFLQVLGASSVSKPIFLTLPLTTAMLIDQKFLTALLNWVTKFTEISGVYVLVSDDRRTKQIQSTALLTSMLRLFTELRRARLGVLAGHLNTESILATLVDDVSLSFGSFENTRIFSLDKFIESEEERRPPKARIYLPRLLNWIQFDQARQIRQADAQLWEAIYTPTSYSESVFEAPVDPAFNQAPLYLHHFECMYKQLHDLASLSFPDRYEAIRQSIQNAISLNQLIGELPLDLDVHGRGDHLQPWLDVTNSYFRSYGKPAA